MFVSLEGIDGAGKSTQAELLAAALGPDSLLLREPGGTPVGEQLRELLKDPSVELSPRTELLLFIAARAELVSSVIRPARAAGRSVVCDRFLDSTVAYQGAARGLGVEIVRELNHLAVGDCVPERTVLLRLPPAEAGSRGAGRGEGGADRFELEGPAFQARVAAAFDRLAEAEPDRFASVDASAGVEQVHRDVLEALGISG
jgi:dTMP kinase